MNNLTEDSGSESNGITTIEAYRKLVTDDRQDRPIKDGLIKIVFAWGSSDTVSYHGSNRKATTITLIPSPTPVVENTGLIEIDISVPTIVSEK